MLSASLWWALLALAAVFLVAGCAPQRPHAPAYQSWAAYYGADAAPEEFVGYDVVVLDSDQHPDVAAIQAQGSKVLAYVSLGEIAPYRHYAQEMSAWPGFVLATNQDWGSQIIDIRNPKWKDYLVDTWIAEAMAKGFDGVMIDTLDTSLAWQAKDAAYAGMSDAAIAIVKEMRRRLPKQKLIMVNRGFDVLPDLVGDIDIVLAESVLVDASKPDRPYFSEAENGQYIALLQDLNKNNPHLSIFALDYPNLSDKTMCNSVYQAQKNHGFVPYISTADLQKIRPYAPDF